MKSVYSLFIFAFVSAGLFQFNAEANERVFGLTDTAIKSLFPRGWTQEVNMAREHGCSGVENQILDEQSVRAIVQPVSMVAIRYECKARPTFGAAQRDVGAAQQTNRPYSAPQNAR